ncbi:hypothetical protein ACM8BJ_23750 [Pseudomonas aeruginosa]|nr:hypothetical protein [Pseudomonas aeruginosa]MDY1219106.1 hypothetical protein [Pseudomonas aeruginosa]HBP6378386.1 hypothetical protein [Pseudomonas aeruginosa]
MAQMVSIPVYHFIGNGNTPFLIVGRVWGDDDDTATLIMADSLPEADALFVEALYESADYSDEDRQELIKVYGSDHIITSRTQLT